MVQSRRLENFSAESFWSFLPSFAFIHWPLPSEIHHYLWQEYPKKTCPNFQHPSQSFQTFSLRLHTGELAPIPGAPPGTWTSAVGAQACPPGPGQSQLTLTLVGWKLGILALGSCGESHFTRPGFECGQSFPGFSQIPPSLTTLKAALLWSKMSGWIFVLPHKKWGWKCLLLWCLGAEVPWRDLQQVPHLLRHRMSEGMSFWVSGALRDCPSPPARLAAHPHPILVRSAARDGALFLIVPLMLVVGTGDRSEKPITLFLSLLLSCLLPIPWAWTWVSVWPLPLGTRVRDVQPSLRSGEEKAPTPTSDPPKVQSPLPCTCSRRIHNGPNYVGFGQSLLKRKNACSQWWLE